MEPVTKRRPVRADALAGRTESVDVFPVAMATRTDAKVEEQVGIFFFSITTHKVRFWGMSLN